MVGCFALFWICDMIFRTAQSGTKVGDFFIIRSCMGISAWILFMCIPLCCERMNPCFPRTSRPSRLTAWVLSTRISLSVASQFPDFQDCWSFCISENNCWCLSTWTFAVTYYFVCFFFVYKALRATCVGYPIDFNFFGCCTDPYFVLGVWVSIWRVCSYWMSLVLWNCLCSSC